MSGHSHWSGIKHKKGVADAKRAQIFTKLGHAIFIAARTGGGNPDFNPSLRLAVDKARSFNMPKDKIENSIKKGTGESSDNKLEEAQYEAMGPFGTMLIIKVITDNKNRTVSDLRRILEKHGGKIADVSWNFKRAGIIEIDPKDKKEEAINTAIENEVDDVIEREEGRVMFYSGIEVFNQLNKELAKYNITESSVGYIPQTPVTLDSKEEEKYHKLLDDLDDQPDVQEFFDNIGEK